MILGILGSELIAKLNPDYQKYNTNAIATELKNLDVSNPNNAIYALVLQVQSNRLYTKARNAANSVAFTGLVLFVISYLSMQDDNIEQLRKVMSAWYNARR